MKINIMKTKVKGIVKENELSKCDNRKSRIGASRFIQIP